MWKYFDEYHENGSYMDFPCSREGSYNTGFATSLTFRSEPLDYLTAVRPEQIYHLHIGLLICKMGTQLRAVRRRLLQC